MQGWEDKLLSQARREVLIKDVIQVIPTYTIDCFKLPLGLCNDIEALIKRFWWGKKGGRRRIHWLKWVELTKSKMVGGMGFRDLALFNDSLLAKQAWRLLQNKHSLFYKVFKTRFFPNCTIMEARTSRSASYAWTSILHVRDVLLRGCRWCIGDGKFVSIWQDFWLPRKDNPLVLSPMIKSLVDAKVDVLIDALARQWDNFILIRFYLLFSVHLACLILLAYFTIQLIFATIHGFHCTF